MSLPKSEAMSLRTSEANVPSRRAKRVPSGRAKRRPSGRAKRSPSGRAKRSPSRRAKRSPLADERSEVPSSQTPKTKPVVAPHPDQHASAEQPDRQTPTAPKCVSRVASPGKPDPAEASAPPSQIGFAIWRARLGDRLRAQRSEHGDGPPSAAGLSSPQPASDHREVTQTGNTQPTRQCLAQDRST